MKKYTAIFIVYLLTLFLLTGCKTDEPTAPPQDKTSTQATKTISSGADSLGITGFKLIFDQGTFSSSTSVTVTKDNNVPVALSSSDGIYDAQNVFKVTATGDTLRKPAWITLTYSPGIIPSGMSEADLIIVHFKSSGWEFLQGSVNTQNKTITFQANSFSSFSTGVPVHKVEFPTTYTTLDQFIRFETETVPSTQIQSYDYSYSLNGTLHHDNYYWGILQPPSSIDPGATHGKVAYAAAFMNNQKNPNYNYKDGIEACMVFKLDLRSVTSAALEFDYNSNSYAPYDYFEVEISNSNLVSPLTNLPLSWVTLQDQSGNSYFWGNSTWSHERFEFPQYLSLPLLGLSVRTCGDPTSNGILVRVRFHVSTSQTTYPQNYGPFIDNIIFKTPNYNNPPDQPSDPSPTDGETGVTTNTSLSWTCNDPDNDPLTYDIYFGTSASPALVKSNSGTTTYTPTSLSANKQYYWKIVAKDNHGNSTSGPVWNFTTTSGGTLPTVTTTSITSITSNSATSGGNVTSQGSSLVTVCGVCWSTTISPTIVDSKTVDGSGTGSFTSLITGLSPSTPYYVRAYATNSVGTSYGSQLSFTTKSGGTLPIVITDPLTVIGSNLAVGGGNVTSEGSATVAVRGVCWSNSANPTTADSKTDNGSGTGSFTSLMYGLSPSTPYYVRAYAISSVGTSYGQDVAFTTTSDSTLPTLTTTSITNITSNSAAGGGNVTSEGSGTFTACGVCWSTTLSPTIADSKTVDGSGTGSFTSLITGLSPSTPYYVRAYATNSVGTGYGSQVSFTTSSSVISQGMVSVAGGTFTAGSTLVTITSFKIDKYEVTYELWTDVESWALTHGYTDLVTGHNGYNGYDPVVGSNNPVTMVNWYDIVKWCNARSEKDGFMPVYYTSSTFIAENVYKTGEINIDNTMVNWTANGYRLPTEAEWEFAARGGNSTHGYTYSGSNTIGDVAWYYSNSGNTTHTVGQKSANELGIYDMSGNALEWCWDWYSSTYPSGTTNPRGPSTTQTYRLLRGGSFNDNEYNCWVGGRNSAYGVPELADGINGFRCVQK